MPHSIIRNCSNGTVQCKISNESGIIGAPLGWFTLLQGTERAWYRGAQEFIHFRTNSDLHFVEGSVGEHGDGIGPLGRTRVDLTQAKLVEFHSPKKILVL